MIEVPPFYTRQPQPQQSSIEEDFDSSCPVSICHPSLIKTASFLIFLFLLIVPLSLSLPPPLPHKEKKTQLEKFQPLQGKARQSLSPPPPPPPCQEKKTQLVKFQSLESQSLSLPPRPLKEKKARLVKFQSLQGKAMKVHPLPKKRNNITIQYNPNPRGGPPLSGTHKKLRRLPHIFSRVLELPFRSDADVTVEEGPDFFRFVAETEAIAGGVRAHMVEIHPGVTKIVVRPNGYLGFASLDELELDMWRFRLPESTRPELASAVFEDGELVVTVPKGEGAEEEGEEDDDGGEFMGGMGNNSNSPSPRLVLVQ